MDAAPESCASHEFRSAKTTTINIKAPSPDVVVRSQFSRARQCWCRPSLKTELSYLVDVDGY